MIIPENCNNKTLKERFLHGFFLLTPDGFPLVPFPEKYNSLEEAKASFENWIESYKQQGYYSTHCFGKIPLNALWDYMILNDEPSYPVM